MSNIPYNEDKSLIPKKNLLNLLTKHSNMKIEPEVTSQLQRFGEKMLIDVLSRASMLTKLKKKEIMTIEDVEFIFEKEFDYTFGKKEVIAINNTPSDQHMQRVADVKNNKNYN